MDAVNMLGVRFREVRMYSLSGHPSLIKYANMIWDVPVEEGQLQSPENDLNPL